MLGSACIRSSRQFSSFMAFIWLIGDARAALQQLDPLWGGLFPAELARIVALLVDRVDIGTGGLNVGPRVDGLGSLAREMLAGGIATGNGKPNSDPGAKAKDMRRALDRHRCGIAAPEVQLAQPDLAAVGQAGIEGRS